jgi:rhodanese-related sulfurtransferase
MFQTVQRVLLIVVLGGALGLLANSISPKGIPLIAPPKRAPQPSAFLPIDQAHALWSSGAALFLDARNPEDFDAGHIPKALNLPVEQFPEFFPKVGPMLAPDSQIVVYCDGTECELSHRLADQLRQMGYTNVHILFNGWTTWKTAGFPIEPAK